MDFTKEDIAKLLEDNTFVDQIIKSILADPGASEELAEDLADEIVDVLEDNQDLKKKLVAAALKDEKFKQILMKEVINEIND